MAKKYIVHAGWFDDLNFKYVYPDRQEFDNKEDADAYTKSRLESGFNVKREEIDTWWQRIQITLLLVLMDILIVSGILLTYIVIILIGTEKYMAINL